MTSISTKSYNKWYMDEGGVRVWRKDMDKGKLRFVARMISYDHGHGMYEYVSPVDSEWGAESMFVLADGKNVKEMKGNISFAHTS